MKGWLLTQMALHNLLAEVS